jgi:hypothetical protein
MQKQPEFEAKKLPTALELKESAIRYDLLHIEVFDKVTDEEVIEQYNGVGPDRWSDELRDILSWLLEDVLEAVEVHDLDYYIGGTEEQFHEANYVLGKNVRLLAKKKYGWWRPRRWFLKKLSYKLAEWTDKYGWEGWTKEEKDASNI